MRVLNDRLAYKLLVKRLMVTFSMFRGIHQDFFLFFQLQSLMGCCLHLQSCWIQNCFIFILNVFLGSGVGLSTFYIMVLVPVQFKEEWLLFGSYVGGQLTYIHVVFISEEKLMRCKTNVSQTISDMYIYYMTSR